MSHVQVNQSKRLVKPPCTGSAGSTSRSLVKELQLQKLSTEHKVDVIWLIEYLKSMDVHIPQGYLPSSPRFSGSRWTGREPLTFDLHENELH